MIRKLSTELCNNGFEDIKFFPTKVELSLTAKAKKWCKFLKEVLNDWTKNICSESNRI